MKPPRWTDDPKIRWIGLNDVVALFVVVMFGALVYGAVLGYYNGALRTLVVTTAMGSFGIVMYWLYGKQAAEGGAEAVGVADPTETGAEGAHRGGQSDSEGEP